jgi:hypothetical protein
LLLAFGDGVQAIVSPSVTIAIQKNVSVVIFIEETPLVFLNWAAIVLKNRAAFSAKQIVSVNVVPEGGGAAKTS